MLSIFHEAVTAGARRHRAAAILDLSLRTLKRWEHQDGGADGRHGPVSAPANKLSDAERERILEVANSPEFRDLSPKQIVPILADRSEYIASESSFHRVLHEADCMQHRERSRPPMRRPKALMATGPNQVWSWDITYLPSPVRGDFYRLYVVMDVWSRMIVGWVVHEAENSENAAALIERCAAAQGIRRDQLTLHSDNGSPMKGQTMLAMLQWLGIAASFSRPSVSDDNPHSESLFRTLKYRPGYPSNGFADMDAAGAWGERFVAWYNHEHLHSAIRFVTPGDRHEGRGKQILAKRRRVYEEARRRNPKRWSRETRNWTPIGEVHLNPERGNVAAA